MALIITGILIQFMGVAAQFIQLRQGRPRDPRPQAAHGDREYGYALTRLRVPRTTVAGHASNPAVQARVGGWARAAVAATEARSLKLARFGDNMRNVAVTEGDKVEAEIRLGMSVNTWGVNDLVAVVDAVEEKAVDALVEE